MKIHGLQKMTLLDFPGKVACTVFLGGCNFRCPYCHNFELVDGTMAPQLDDVSLLAFLDKRRGLLDAVCISGGEPLLNPGLPQLVRTVKEMGFAVKLDTNGTSPDALTAMIADGLLDYVAMDIKASPRNYAVATGLKPLASTTGAGATPTPAVMAAAMAESTGTTAISSASSASALFDAVQRSVDILLKSGIEFEFRTTLVRGIHDENEIREICNWIKGAKRYFLQPFVDRDTVPQRGLEAPNHYEIERLLAVAREAIPNAEIRGA